MLVVLAAELITNLLPPYFAAYVGCYDPSQDIVG